MKDFSYISNSDIAGIEALYKKYKEAPEVIDKSFRDFFSGYEFAQTNFDGELSDKHCSNISKEFNVLNLIHGYRQRGHLFTKTNPVRVRRKYFPKLNIENFNLSKSDLETEFEAGKSIGIGKTKLKNIIEHLKTTYCQSIGAEYLYVRRPEVVEWLQTKMEKDKNTPNFNVLKKKSIYKDLLKAVSFENFIHRKFVGQKRFSLEGSEAVIPGLHAIINKSADMEAQELMIGMAHRGRLNVMANVLKKPYARILNEFTGAEYEGNVALGDVKYHLGYQNDVRTNNNKKVRVSLVPNASHLESVGAVIEGITRATIDHKYAGNYNKVIPVIIHGDAAIAGQGIVYEIIQMSSLKGYMTGGTIHIVINNQVGFTTNYLDARSSTYCTDVGKVTRSPVFHINGDDVEAMVHTLELAVEYRQKFHSDVFIDILSYRKYGHNEGDEPRFTQPTLYEIIKKHPTPSKIYADKLLKQQVYKNSELKQLEENLYEQLEEQYDTAQKTKKVVIDKFLTEIWKNYKYADNEDFEKKTDTSYNNDELKKLAYKINELPTNKKFLKKALKITNNRIKMINTNKLDWAMGELLAYATLLTEGYPVRLSGQDSIRGTFAHRHASITIEDSDRYYTPLEHISNHQASFNVFNSPLSEYGVMGFEYGYALANPNSLNIWEAQFGDFYNVAQVIVDQYISSAEEKWGLRNGLVLYLPHGYEGQGPEHSNARIERFLSLAAYNNMQIVNCTSPANMYHVLRRQMKRNIRVPLIIFTPKSLLRHPQCTSKIEELAQGTFQEVIDDDNNNIDEVRRLVFCSGKIYYDLLARKNELNDSDVAIIRVEQLHPFPQKKINNIIKKYKKTKLRIWVQEEPINMGAWNYINNNTRNEFVPIARLASGSPATGLSGLHVLGQKHIINNVFKPCNCKEKNKYCTVDCIDGDKQNEILKQHKYFSDVK